MQSQVLSGYEDKHGDIYVEYMLAESGYLNQNDIGFTPQLLEQWHSERAWEGRVHNAHPTKNHPLAYAAKPTDKSPLAQISYYLAESAKWAFGTYIKTKLNDIKNGQKRLNGIVRITEEKAKAAWRDKKFPLFSSSSVYIIERDPVSNLITSAIPIASTSVDRPAFPQDVAGIYNQCEGGDECVTKLAESGCNYCRYDVLTSFENIFSSNSSGKLSENSMTDDSSTLTPPSGESTGTPIDKVSETHTSADGKNTETTQEEVNWKEKYEALEKEHKEQSKKVKEYDAYKAETDKRFEKIFKEKLESKVRNIVEKVPLDFFEKKEENREAEIQKHVKKYPKLTEEEILEDVQDKFKIAQVITVQTKSKGLKESGLISNDAPLRSNTNTATKGDVGILDITEVFG